MRSAHLCWNALGAGARRPYLGIRFIRFYFNLRYILHELPLEPSLATAVGQTHRYPRDDNIESFDIEKKRSSRELDNGAIGQGF